jgi:hypothetical protein
MAYKAWTPVIVGGTDMDDTTVADVPANKPAVGSPPNDEVITTTHEELADYAKSIDSIPTGSDEHIDKDDITWTYEPKQKRDGERGQYVIEKHNGRKHQVYWVRC